MIRQDIDIDGYWKVIVAYDVYLGQLNAGFTQTDYSRRLSIVGIGLVSSRELFFNTIVHEAKHVLSHICKYYKVPEDGELAAYLIGYLVMRMFEVFREII